MSGAPILLMAGGTGGHVFPALAVADSLRRAGRPVVWLGTRDGIEARLLPGRGIHVEWLRVSGLRGKGWRAWLLAPFRLLAALCHALRIVHRHRPGAVLGMGGYVSGPGGVAAWLLRRPLLVHEQNAVAGHTNRILARLAGRVLCGFPGVLGGEWVGNPVRDEIASLPDPAQRLRQRAGRLRVLVLGGSQGARALNEVLPPAVAALPPVAQPEVWHQCGRALLDEARAAWHAAGLRVEPLPFIDDMAAAYAWADLVVCRAGALTVAEIAAAGVASILVPLPGAVDDHQTANARFLADAGAAEMLPQPQLDAATLAARLTHHADDRAGLLRMALAARGMARPGATAAVSSACLQSAGVTR